MTNVKNPEFDLPKDLLGGRLRGASDTWDQPQASVVLGDDYLPAGPLIPVMTFDPLDKSPGLTLSSGNLTATASADSASTMGYRSLTSPEDYIFYSVTVNSGGPFFMGISRPNRTRPSNLTIDSSTTFSAAFGTSEWVGARLVGLSVGDVVDLAYNRVAARLYHRINGGAWNSSGDPAAGTGGSVLGTFTSETVVPLISLSNGAGLTANFGSTAFTYPPPSGFVSWEEPPAGGLSANNLVSGAPVVGTSTLAQTYVFASNNLTAGAPVLQTSTLNQEHTLTSVGLTAGAPVVGTPTAAITSALTATNLTADSPVVGTTTLNQTHAVTANSLVAGSPVVGTSTLNQQHALTSVGLTSGAPVVGSSTLNQKHALTSVGLASGSPVVGSGTLAQQHALTSVGVAAGAPVVGTGTLNQTHALSGVDVTAGSPVVGTPTLAVSSSLLTANNLTAGNPVVGTSTLGQTHNITSVGIVAGAPVVGQPSAAFTSNLSAGGITSGAPIVGSSTLGEIVALSAVALVSGDPEVGQSTLGQQHILSGVAIEAGEPVLEGPQLLGIADSLSADGITAGDPVVGTSTLSQVHNFNVISIEAEAPVVEAATIGQVHVLSGQSIVNGVPSVSVANLFKFQTGVYNVANTVHTLAESRLTTVSPEFKESRKQLVASEDRAEYVPPQKQLNTTYMVAAEQRKVTLT